MLKRMEAKSLRNSLNFAVFQLQICMSLKIINMHKFLIFHLKVYTITIGLKKWYS